MNQNFVGSIYMYGRFYIMFPQSRMKGEWHSAHWASSFEGVIARFDLEYFIKVTI